MRQMHWVGGQGDECSRLARVIGQHSVVSAVRCQHPLSAHAALNGAVGGDAVVAQRVAQRRTQIQPRTHFL